MNERAQQQLFKPVRGKKAIASQCDRYEAGNLYSAREIVANPGQYGGPDSGLSQWAREFLERAEDR